MIYDITDFYHYATIAFSIAATSLGVGIGEGLASQAAIEAINIQPGAKNDISRAAIVGMALIETAAVMGLTMAVILLLDAKNHAQSVYANIAELGIAFAICISGLVLGIVSALPTRAAVLAIARQPFFNRRIFAFMIITQSIIQTPIIFGFIVAMFIRDQSWGIKTLPEAIRLISSGLCIGIGSIGPAIGLAHFAQKACQGMGINRSAYNKILSFTFISEAIIETPIIFALIVSLVLLTSSIEGDNMLRAIAMLSSALCIGFGTIGAGIGSGKTAAAACEQIALNPDKYSLVSRISLFAQGLIDTAAIYALLISLSLLYFV